MENITLDQLAGMIKEQFDEVGHKFDEVNNKFDEVNNKFDEVNKRFDEVDKRFDEVDNKFDAVDKRFDEVDKRFDEVNGRLGKIESNMLTKDYLDDKLADLRGDLVVLTRKEDSKVRKLIDILRRRELISDGEVKEVLSMEPFPQLFV